MRHGLQLAGEPCEEWIEPVRKLKASVMAFKGVFDTWVTQSIVKNLRDALHIQYRCYP